MAKSLTKANERWKDHTSAAGAAWEQGKTRAINEGAYAKGLEEMDGVSGVSGSRADRNWKEGLGKATQSDFTTGVSKAAAADKWKKGFLRGITKP